MSRMSWRNPPPIVVVGGDEDFLRTREIRKAVQITQQSNRPVIQALTDGEVVDAITSAGTFGEACLVLCPLGAITPETVKWVKESPPERTGVLLHHDDNLDEKKFPVLKEIHGGFQIQHQKPTNKKGLLSLAVRFSRKEAEELVGEKDALEEKLAEALVDAAGTDLGVLSFELSKVSALLRFSGEKKITAEHLKKLLRPSADLNLAPLREALRNRDEKRLTLALQRILKNSTADPVMLLLRGKGGPADLAVQWLRAAIFLRRGGESKDLAARLGVPDWSVPEILTALKKWDISSLRELIALLARVDLSVLRGSPNSLVALESSLLLACRKS